MGTARVNCERERKKLAFRSPEILAPARMPVAEGKKMENMPKKLPPGPRQLGTKFSAKMSAVGHKRKKHVVPHMRLCNLLTENHMLLNSA